MVWAELPNREKSERESENLIFLVLFGEEEDANFL